jgi:proteic killer suppression protein
MEARAIEISFGDKKLESSCTREAECRRRWGANCRVVQVRLVTLAAAETLADMSLAPGRCHALKADRAGQYAVHLWGPYRLVFVPDHDPLPQDPHGGIDVTKVTRIQVLEIVNYHGD